MILDRVLSESSSGSSNIGASINTDMVTCLAEMTQMAAEVDSTIIERSKYLLEIMQVFKESAIHVHEKSLNKQLITFYSHLVMGRKS